MGSDPMDALEVFNHENWAGRQSLTRFEASGLVERTANKFASLATRQLQPHGWPPRPDTKTRLKRDTKSHESFARTSDDALRH